ncbi:MAG: tetratricopeptide repeat protein [Actinomycetes bacterium]
MFSISSKSLGSRLATGVVAVGMATTLAACSSNDAATVSGTPTELMKQGLAAQQGGANTKATEIYNQLIASNPKNEKNLNTYAYYNLGVINQSEGNSKAAITEYQSAISLTPTYLPALFNLATAQTPALPQGVVVYPAADQTGAKEAVSTYNRILVIKPTDANTLFNVGLLNYGLGNTALGREQLNQAIAGSPSLATRVPAGITLK